LPKLGVRLLAMRDELEEGSGMIRLSGVPCEGLSVVECRVLLWALSIHLGTPVSQSASGERILSVRDLGYAENDPRTRGPHTRKRLSFHTDRCDVIGFLCLNQAWEGGENEVVSSMHLYNEILRRRPDLLAVLMGPFHYQRHTVDQGNSRAWCRQPVFSFRDGYFACSFLRVLIERAHQSPELPDLTPEQIEALDFLESVAEEESMRLRFRQKPGDVLFLNNWVMLHRRTAFEDHVEAEKKRHILRIWLSMPNSRPLDPLFKDNFGATEAGAIRGGMLKRV